MFDSFRHPWSGKGISLKGAVAFVLFAVMIVATAVIGIGGGGDRGGSTGGGTAAVVNDASIPIAEYRQRVEMMERNSRLPFDKLPPDQREMYTREMGRRTLEQMILSEIVFQTAGRYGIWAPDAKVRDELLSIPIFQDQGRFTRERYDNYLAAVGQNSDDFEQRIRKDLVIRRVQGLFSAAGEPSTLELAQLADLQSSILGLRYVDLSPAKLASEKAVSDSALAAYLKDPAKQADIKKYYDEHVLDYQLPEKVRASHILLMVDEKHPDKDVLEKAKALRQKLNLQNFASIAQKESQDPGSAKKGGDLGSFEKGRMVPQFEEVAFKLKPGEISEPVKSSFGYHIILVQDHQVARKVALDEAKSAIGRKLLAEANAPAVLAEIKKAVATGKASEVDSVIKKFGLAWQKADNVNLSSPQIPGMMDAQEVMEAAASRPGKTGLIDHVVGKNDHTYAVEVTNWKMSDTTPDPEKLRESISEQSSSEAFEDWVKTAEAKATVTRNQHLFER